MKVIRIVDIAGTQTLGGDPRGLYVVDCDVDAHGGRGEANFTADIGQAKKFEDSEHALIFYRRTSTIMPIRPDGRPNRPLTAYTIEVFDA